MRVPGLRQAVRLACRAQIGVAERDACAHARADVAETYDADRQMPGQGGEGGHQAQVDQAPGELGPGGRLDGDPPVGQQPGAGRLGGGHVTGLRGLVRDGPMRGNDPDGDARGPGAERREDGRRPGPVEAGTEQRPDGARFDDNGRAAWIGRKRPEHEQVA